MDGNPDRNPYSSSQFSDYVDRIGPESRLGCGFVVSILCGVLVFLGLPAVPVNLAVFGLAAVVLVAGFLSACVTVRGKGWLAMMPVMAVYGFLLYVAWLHL